MLPLRIIATGKALPSRLITAEQLDRELGYPSGHCLRKSGVRQRRFASTDLSQSQLGARALHDALDHAGISVDSIDLLIGACGVQEQALPSTACHIAHHARLSPGVPSVDVGASCLSFMLALQMAASLMLARTYRRVAIVSADLPSRGIDWSDPESSLIFGDGAAAAIVEQGGRDQGIESFRMATYSEGRHLCQIRGGGTLCNPRTDAQPHDYLFHMNAKGVFKLTARAMPEFIRHVMQPHPNGINDIDWVVPHQASHLGMSHIAKRLGIPVDRIVSIYETHGNQVAASMPTALHEVLRGGRAQPGHRLLLIGTAAGLTLGGLTLTL